MTNLARAQHARLDREHAEAMARDGDEVSGRFAQTCGNLPPDIARPRRWRQDATVTGGPQPKVLVLKLRQRVSARGNTYLDGWMGQAKLIGFKDAEPDQYGNETWSIYAVTPQPKGERT
jgi:hypothetical protein